MVKARKYFVVKQFHGVPKREDYEIIEYELPPLQDGEILAKAEWISVDPYLRSFHSKYEIPYEQFGYQLAVVEDSKDPNYPVGTRLVSHQGWVDYFIVKDQEMPNPEERIYKLPDLKGLPASYGIGAVGMPGATAYFGLLEICKPQPGETVVVSGAAGAVGTVVGQIAKIKGCRVIGFAGSDEKVRWLEEELGFDKAINYKTENISKALKQAAPKGVDCYFDNVGGELSSVVLYQMNLRGRVTVCGSISSYNDSHPNMSKATLIQQAVIFSRLKIEGIFIWDFIPRWGAAFAQLVEWIKKGQLKVKEHVTEDFDNLFDAFVGIFAGENYGKAVVKV